MQPKETGLAAHQASLLSLRERLIRSVGIHTVNVLLERAIWEASREHPELTLIQRVDDSLSFDGLERAYAGRPEEEIAAAFNGLVSELLLILARLLRHEKAQRLAEELEAKTAQEE